MFIPLLLTIITFCPSLQGMEKKEPKEDNDYSTECRAIKAVLEHEKNDFFKMIYSNSLNPAQELASIKQQFTYYENRLNQERSASLLQLKNFHNISDEIWSAGMNNLEFIKTKVKNHINTHLPDATHDPIVSGENKIFFAEQLKKYDLDIKKIYIEKKDAPKDELSSFLSVTRNRHDGTISIYSHKPQSIISSTQFNQMSSAQQKGTLLKLAWIMGNVCTIHAAFIYFIAAKTDKDYDFYTLQQSKEYLSFLRLEQEKFSDIFPCLEGYQACLFMENLRSYSYLNDLSLEQNKERIRQICLIKNLWEKRILLEELIQQKKTITH